MATFYECPDCGGDLRATRSFHPAGCACEPFDADAAIAAMRGAMESHRQSTRRRIAATAAGR